MGPPDPHMHLLSPVQGQLPTAGTLTGKSVYLLLSLIDGLALSCIWYSIALIAPLLLIAADVDLPTQG